MEIPIGANGFPLFRPSKKPKLASLLLIKNWNLEPYCRNRAILSYIPYSNRNFSFCTVIVVFVFVLLVCFTLATNLPSSYIWSLDGFCCWVHNMWSMCFQI